MFEQNFTQTAFGARVHKKGNTYAVFKEVFIQRVAIKDKQDFLDISIMSSWLPNESIDFAANERHSDQQIYKMMNFHYLVT